MRDAVIVSRNRLQLQDSSCPWEIITSTDALVALGLINRLDQSPKQLITEKQNILKLNFPLCLSLAQCQSHTCLLSLFPVFGRTNSVLQELYPNRCYWIKPYLLRDSSFSFKYYSNSFKRQFFQFYRDISIC